MLMYEICHDQCSRISVENNSAVLLCFWVLNWSNQLTCLIWSRRWELMNDGDYTLWFENFTEWSISYSIHESWSQSAKLFAWRLQRMKISIYLSLAAATLDYRKKRKTRASSQNIWKFQPTWLSSWSKYSWLYNWFFTADYWSSLYNHLSLIRLERLHSFFQQLRSSLLNENLPHLM